MSQDNITINNSDVKKLAVFGGSFDPIQNSHIKIIKKLSTSFDKVLVVPSFVSPFKTGVKTAPSHFRVEMVKEACIKMLNVEVDKYEVNYEGISYTYNTVKHIAEEYPNARITLVLGQDNLAGLVKWHNIEELSTMVDFLVIPRKNFTPTKALTNKLAKSGIEFTTANFTADDHSSSVARVNVAFSKYSSIPSKAKSIITKNGFYSDYNEIVSTFTAFGLEEERVAHIYLTTLTAIELAKLHSVDITDTITASLLHDIAKRVDKNYLIDNAMHTDEDVPPSVAHAFNGELVAKRYFGIKKKAILNAIKYHTTAQPKMEKLSKIIFLADALEPSREDERLDRIKTIAHTNLDWAMGEMLALTIEHLEKANKTIYPLTLEAYEFYKEKIKTTKVAVLSRCGETATGIKLANQIAELKELPKPKTKKATVKKVAKAEEVKIEEPKAVVKKEIIDAPIKKEAIKKAEIIVEEIISTEPQRATKQFVLSNNKNKDPQNVPEDMAYEICACLDKHKGYDVTVINLETKSLVADYFVIASVRSNTAVRALTEYVDEKLSKEYFVEPYRRDIADNWSAIDYGSVIMHIQIEDTRKFYDLERLWNDGTNTIKFN